MSMATPLPYTIALTGGIASGKSTIAQCFEQLGAKIVDADVIARQLVEPNQPALAGLVAHFGHEMLTTEGILDRSALRAHIFHHPQDKAWLEAYLHPLIRHSMIQEIAQTPQGHYAIAVIPLLQETGIPEYVSRVLVVDCHPEVQRERLMKRDAIDESLALKIIQQQAKREARLAIADDVIDNSNHELSEEERKNHLMTQCLALHQRYQSLTL
jgi:dephospho-CoA kinase